MVTALYPGSFDPFHNGHLGFVEVLAEVYDRVVVAVLANSSKNPLLPAQTRADLIASSVNHLRNVRAVAEQGLTVDAVEVHEADVIVRAFGKEFRNEMQMAAMNGAASSVRTQFVAAPVGTASISSSFVRERLAAGDVAGIEAAVPRPVLEALRTLP